MVTISKSLEMHASVDRVWDIISDMANDQKYWTNIREIKVLSSNGNMIEREAVVGPSAFGQKTHQTILLVPKKSIEVKITGESMSGHRSITLAPAARESTKVEVTWELEAKGIPRFVQGIIKNQISKATEQALAKIAKEAGREGAGRRFVQ